MLNECSTLCGHTSIANINLTHFEGCDSESLSSLEKLEETEFLTCETLSWEAFHTDQVNFIRIHAFCSCIEQRMYIRGFVQP